jgi:hypothetical protein
LRSKVTPSYSPALCERTASQAGRKDRISGWRWFLGAWGIGTYRQDDTVDIRYEANGETRLGHGLPITLVDDE